MGLISGLIIEELTPIVVLSSNSLPAKIILT